MFHEDVAKKKIANPIFKARLIRELVRVEVYTKCSEQSRDLITDAVTSSLEWLVSEEVISRPVMPNDIHKAISWFNEIKREAI